MAERYVRRRMTDRKDGRRLRTISPLFQLSPFTMLNAADAASSLIIPPSIADIGI